MSAQRGRKRDEIGVGAIGGAAKLGGVEAGSGGGGERGANGDGDGVVEGGVGGGELDGWLGEAFGERGGVVAAAAARGAPSAVALESVDMDAVDDGGWGGGQRGRR